MSSVVGEDPRRQLFDRHVESVLSGDPDAVVALYAPDAVVMRANETVRGRGPIRAVYARMFAASGVPPRPDWEVQLDGEAIFAVWTIDGPGPRRTGCETLLVRDGLIALHTLFSA